MKIIEYLFNSGVALSSFPNFKSVKKWIHDHNLNIGSFLFTLIMADFAYDAFVNNTVFLYFANMKLDDNHSILIGIISTVLCLFFFVLIFYSFEKPKTTEIYKCKKCGEVYEIIEGNDEIHLTSSLFQTKKTKPLKMGLGWVF